VTEEERQYFGGLLGQVNDNIERVLERMGSLERDFQNTKEFLVGDALISGRQRLDMETRITKLERGLRKDPE
jgi:hypothetical protein